MGNTPNEERLDAFEKQIQKWSSHENMADWRGHRVDEQRISTEVEFDLFRGSFPHRGSCLQGLSRAWAAGESEERKYALTDDEDRRIREIRQSVLGGLNLAEGKNAKESRYFWLEVAKVVIDAAKTIIKAARFLLR